MKPIRIIIAIIALVSCQSPSEKKVEQYTPNPKAIHLNEEAIDIIKETLFTTDSLNVPLLNDALKKLDEAIALDSQYFYSYLNKATIFKTLGHYDYALIEYEKAARFDTDNPELILSQGLILEKLGKTDFAQSRYSEAIHVYEKLIKDAPNNVDFKISRAFIFAFTQGKEEALSQLSYIEAKTEQDKSKIEQMTAMIESFQRKDYVSNF